jgi:LysM repeat protein
MRDKRQVLWGIITVLIAIVFLTGVYFLSIAEGNLRLSAHTPSLTPTNLQISPMQPSRTLPPTITLTLKPFPSVIVSPTLLPSIATPTLPSTMTPTLAPTGTPTLIPSPTNCPPPLGWLPYIVRSGDTLDGLALRYKTTIAEIWTANCLATSSLLFGQIINLPPLPTQTRIPCGAPRTWVIYIVQPGDTLYHLGQVYGIPYTVIQKANCLPNTTIHIGQSLYVPPWATRTPSPTIYGSLPTDTPMDPWTETPTDTPTPTP